MLRPRSILVVYSEPIGASVLEEKQVVRMASTDVKDKMIWTYKANALMRDLGGYDPDNTTDSLW